MQELPDPLVPPEVDLTDFKFMPLEVARLLQSEWWLTAGAEDPRRAYAAVNLWSKAWHQIPAASLPDSDIVLSKMADVPLAVWREIRDVVMEPWTLCSDGRWYHPVVAEKAREAWEQKLEFAKRNSDFSQHQSRRAKSKWEKYRAKSAAGSAENVPDECRMSATGTNSGVPDECRKDANEREKDREKEREKDREKIKSANALSTDPDGSAPSLQPKGEGYTADFERWWEIYPRKEGKGAAFRAYRTAKKMVAVERLTEATRSYAERVKDKDPQYIKQPATWLNQHCWNDEAEKPKRRYPPGYVPMAANGG